MKRIHVLAIIVATFAVQSFADQKEPAYWLKKYPDAPQAKVAQCLAKAEAAYDKAGGAGMWGDNGFAVLVMGNAWEACMEGK